MYLLVHVFISLCVYSIALSDPETGEYILNGNFIVSPQRKILRYAGVNIEYSGSNSIVEQINSSIPLNKELVVEVSDRFFFLFFFIIISTRPLFKFFFYQISRFICNNL